MARTRFALRLALVAVVSFAATQLALHAQPYAYGLPGPAAIPSTGQVVATAIDESSREMYLLDAGSDSIIVADIDTQLVKSTIALNSILGAVDSMDLNEVTHDLVVATDGGGVYTVTPSTSTQSTIIEDASRSWSGVLADTFFPSVEAYAHDATGNNLHEASVGSSTVVMAGPGTGGMLGMYQQGSLSTIGGLQPGSGAAVAWTYDRNTTADDDASYMGATPTGGAYAGGDTYFATVNNGGLGELLRINIAPALGWVLPPEQTYSDPAMDVAYSNGFLSVVTGTNAPTGMKINVLDFGDGANLMDVGTLNASGNYPSPSNHSILIDSGGTYHDLIYVVASAGQGADTGSVGGDESSFEYVDPDVVTANGIDDEETGGGHVAHAPNYCTGLQGESYADGTVTSPATNGRMEYATGEELHSRHLFTVPGIGMNLEMVLTYRSQRNHAYRYGRGWYLNHDARMRTEPNGDEFFRSGFGRHETYPKIGPNYIAPPNFDTSLTVSAGARTITDRFGVVTTYNAAGYRTSVTDRYGNAITYTWSGDQLTSITDTRGKNYTLAYDTSGRLSSVTDYGGRTWTMAYDYRGNLRQITTPGSTQHPNGRVYRYSYSPSNSDPRLADNLVHVWSAKGDVVQTLHYDANDLVTSEQIGPGTYDISYDLPNSQTTVEDPSGNTTTWTFDANGYVSGKEEFTRGLRAGEPASFVTSFELGPVSNLIEAIIYPRDNRVEYSYDAQLNLLQVRLKETNTTGSGPSDIVVTHEYNAPFNQRSKTTDARGNVTLYTVDANGNTTAISRPTVTSPATQSITETYTYDAQGRLTSAIDGAGRKMTFDYYATGSQAGWLSTITRDPAGLALTTTFAYDQFGNLTSATDPRGNTTTFTVDAENFVTEVTSASPFNFKNKFFYDANGDLERKEVENRDRKGVLDPTTPWIITNYAYNAVGWKTSKTVPLSASANAVTTYEHDGSGLVTKVTNAENEVIEAAYDERGRIFTITSAAGSADAASIQVDYDLNGNMAKLTNARGFASTFTYDLFDRPTRSVNPLGNYIEYEYDKSSNMTSQASFDAGDVLLAAQTNHFDEVNRRWKIERSRFGPGLTASNPTTIFKRDAGHRVIEVTDPLGRKTTSTFDAAGRRSGVKDAANNETNYTLDGIGNAVAIERVEVPSSGPAETYLIEQDFDELNRLIERREVDRLTPSNVLTTTFEYDSRNNMTFRTDAEVQPVRWQYDLGGRLTDYERALAVGPTIDVFTDAIHETMTYDKVNRLLTVTDDNFNATAYEYDERGRPKKATFADSKYVSRTFDEHGNVATWTDQNGTTVTNTFDSNDRLVRRDITRGTGVVGPTVETYVYDAMDRLVHAEDDDFQFDRVYDSLGNLLSEDQGYTASGQEKWKTVSTGWNDAGAQINVTYPSGRLFSFSRDAVDRLLSITEVATQQVVASTTWQGVGRRNVVTNQNGTTTEYGYDGFARLTSLEHFTPTVQTFHRFDYAYDKIHRRRMEKNTFSAAWINTLPTAVQTFLNPRNGKGDVFAYDMASRMVDARFDVSNPLTEVGSPGSQQYGSKVVYTVDGNGNRSQVEKTPWGGSPVTTTYASDVVNQYTTIGVASREHDDNGNLKDDGTHLYSYDYKNRLVEAKLKSSGATIATYKYDPSGRRVEKDVTGGSVTRYVLNRNSVVEEYDGADAWKASYVHDDSLDFPCATDRVDHSDVDGDLNTTETIRLHYAQNAMGSVSEITAPSGAVVEWVTYDAYGMPTVRDKNGVVVGASAVGNPFLFTGREWDVETGTYFYRARTYDPESGRFLQRDPLGYVDGLSAYEYARSQPATLADPLGLSAPGGGDDPPTARNDDLAERIEKELQKAIKDVRKAMQDNVTKRQKRKAESGWWDSFWGSLAKALRALDAALAAAIDAIIGPLVDKVVELLGEFFDPEDMVKILDVLDKGLGLVGGAMDAMEKGLVQVGLSKDQAEVVRRLVNYGSTVLGGAKGARAIKKRIKGKRDFYKARVRNRDDGLEIGEKISEKDAVKRLRDGNDVFTEKRSDAKRVQKKASGNGKVILEGPHVQGGHLHFHDWWRRNGHSFFGPEVNPPKPPRGPGPWRD